MTDQTLTQSRLKELFHYNYETGIFTRIKTVSHKAKCGDVSGSLMQIGYLTISIDGYPYYSHRLAWLYHFGLFPANEIDHVNGIKIDNKISNLRDVTKLENRRNMKLRSDSSSGIVGVCWHRVSKKWMARINIKGRNIHIGMFTLKSDAKDARKEAEKRYGFHEGHGRVITNKLTITK